MVRGHLLRRADQHRGVAAARPRQPVALRRAQHLARITQRAGTRDDEVRRHDHGVVDVAVLEVELRAEIRLGVPAAQVVVYRHAREPLRDLVDVAVARRRHRGAAAPRAGDDVVPAYVQLQPRLRRQRPRQGDPHARVGGLEGRRHDAAAALDADLLDHVAVGVLPPEIGRQERGARSGPVDVLVELHPELVERVGAVVAVADHLVAREGMAPGVDGGGDPVVGAVLPVGGSGRAAGGTIGVGGIFLHERREDAGRIRRRRRARLRWEGREQEQGDRDGADHHAPDGPHV